jgi:hypothetical protein
MESVSTKLAFWVLGMPIFYLVCAFLIGFYFYRGSLDASAFFTAVSSLLSAILVIFLVWERLRDSLSKKLGYLHRNYLFKLYKDFEREGVFWTKDETKRLRLDLERYGEFLNIRLYPKGLPSMIDGFLSSHGEFYKRLKKIEEIAKKQTKKESELHTDAIWEYVGFAEHGFRSEYVPEVEEKHKQIAQSIISEHPQLVSEAKAFLEKTRVLNKQISDKLENFLKSNNLRLEEETSSTRW